MNAKNQLYFGDNLKILREYVPDAGVDLIYLDPPFNSNANYNVLFKEKSGEESAAQITAFEDTWQWSVEAEAVYREIVERGPRKLADLVQALLAFLGRNDMMAYLREVGIPGNQQPPNRRTQPSSRHILRGGQPWDMR